MARRSVFVLLLVVACVFVVAAPALAANPHFVGTPTCTVSGGTTVVCSGKIAGLGTAPTTVSVSVPADCQNRGGNLPPGQATGTSAPINPRGGQITYSVSTDPVRCPDDMQPIFGSTATITVVQNGQVVFTGTVPVTQ
jgi:hypothetical protein